MEFILDDEIIDPVVADLAVPIVMEALKSIMEMERAGKMKEVYIA